MKLTVKYQGNSLGVFEGKDFQAAIEDNFSKIREIVKKEAGNAAGYELEKVWVENNVLHVMAHGSDTLLGYDPTDDPVKEICFTIEDIEIDSFEFEIKEKNQFNPFTINVNDKVAAFGVLKACVDFLAMEKYRGNRERYTFSPSEKVSMHCVTLQRTNASRYIEQLMKYFAEENIERTRKNQKVFDLIEKLNAALVDCDPATGRDGLVSFYYHKSKYYFSRMNKTTALRSYRMAAGKTQKEMADILGIGVRQYQRYESLDSPLGNTTSLITEKIAEVLHVDFSDIVKDGEIVLMEEENRKWLK